MNWTVLKTVEQPFIKVVTKGDFNLNDHLRMIEDIVSRDFWKPGTKILFDNRNLDFDSTNISIMNEATINHVMYDEQIGSAKSAILMNSLADYGRGIQFELFAQTKVSATLHIFLDEKEAVDWLIS